MMLCKFGPRRLSPSLIVWQVRHALLNINCPNPASAPARAGSWGTADDDSRIRSVEQASPTIAVRGMKASISEYAPVQMCSLAIERAVATMCSSVCRIAENAQRAEKELEYGVYGGLIAAHRARRGLFMPGARRGVISSGLRGGTGLGVGRGSGGPFSSPVCG